MTEEELIQLHIDKLGSYTSKMRRYADRPATTHEVSELVETINSGLYEIDKVAQRDRDILFTLYAMVTSSPESKKLFDHYYEEVKKRGGTGIKFNDDAPTSGEV